MSTEIDEKLVEKLSLLLYPECLDFSKVISILNDDFTFSGNDLYSLKEITKLFESKEILFNYLAYLSKRNNPIISVNDDFSKCQLIIKDNLIYYQFVNIPSEYNSERVKLLLGLNDEDYSRLYRSSIFWALIVEKEEINKKLEESLKEISVDKEGKKLKYNITKASMIKTMAKKQIDKRIYNKETQYLKVNDKNTIEFNRGKKNEDSMSWRKKSDLSDNQDNKNTKDNYLSLGYTYKKGGHKHRQRFKSDPYEYNENEFYNSKKNNNNINNDYQKDVEDLKPQLDNVNYPLFIKEKYSNKDMLEYLAKIKSEIKFDEKNFGKIIEDIIDQTKIKSLELESKTEYEVPKNSPLLNFGK